MPPRRQIEKESILSRAFEMTRASGFASITARSLAASLGCSTQPIYQSFADMKTLEAEVAARSAQFMLERIRGGAQNELPRDLSFVLEYIRFALEERHLLQIIAQNGLFRDVTKLTESTPFSEGSTPPLDQKLVIFANGIVFLTAFQSAQLSWPQIQTIVTEAYTAFQLSAGKGREQNP